MITRNRYDFSDDLSYQGLSTDTPKPTENVPINAMFLELDTGKFYYFDGTSWEEVGGGS